MKTAEHMTTRITKTITLAKGFELVSFDSTVTTFAGKSYKSLGMVRREYGKPDREMTNVLGRTYIAEMKAAGWVEA